MGWELTNFSVEHNGELARVFNFEVTFSGEADEKQRLMRGDGLIMRNGTIRFNRAEELKDTVAEAGMNPENFMDYFARWVITEVIPPRLAVGSA